MSIRRKHYLPTILPFFLLLCYNSQASLIKSVKNGTWNDPSVWDSAVPGALDSVLIDGHLISATNLNITVKSIHLTNDSGSEVKLSLLGTTHLISTEGFYVQGEGKNADVNIYLQDDAILEVLGLLNIQRLPSNADANLVRLLLNDQSVVYAKNGFIFDYHNSDLLENNHEIELNGSARLEVTGNTEFYNRTGTEFSVHLNSTAKLISKNNFTARLFTGGAMLFEVNNFALFNIKGDGAFTNSAGTGDIDINLNFGGDLTIEGNLNMQADLSGKKVWISLNGTFSDLTVDGNINFNTSFNQTVGINLYSFSDIHLSGNINRPNGYGSLEMSDNAIFYLKGSTVQTIPATAGAGTDSIKISNLNINSTADSIILGGPLLLTESLELTNGVIKTSTANSLTLADQVTITGGSSQSYIDGPVSKIGRNSGDPFTFPVGSGGIYAPVTTSVVSDPTSEYTVQYFRATPPTGTLAVGLDAISNLEYWFFDMESGSQSVNVTLGWDDAETSGIQDTSDLVMSMYNSGTTEWMNIGASEKTGGDNIGESGTVTHDLGCPPPCCHSILTLATLAPTNLLPLDLLSLSAQVMGDQVFINWVTSNEIDMENFEVERSLDAINFSTIAEVASKGQLGFYHYQTIDPSPQSGQNYYRLKITDAQGMIEYTDLVNAKVEENIIWQAYPNPVKNHFQLMGVGENTNGNIKIEVFNQMGQRVYRGQLSADDLSLSLSTESLNIKLSGIYRLHFSQNGKTTVVNLFKE